MSYFLFWSKIGNMEQKAKKIILTGGGTAGSVSPLLALAEELRRGGEF